MDDDVKRQLDELCSGVKSFAFARHMWKECLTDGERRSLGRDVEKAWRKYGTLGLWGRLKNLSGAAALVDLCHSAGLLAPGKHNKLLRELEIEQRTHSMDLPSWDRVTGTLYFDNAPIRRLRKFKSPSKSQLILQRFQSRGWPKRIKVPRDWLQQTTHDVVRSLNAGLKTIRFHATDGGTTVYWTLLT
jgi:hypothetical protein